jgi:hypothetical protein
MLTVPYIVHSADGTTLSALPVDREIGSVIAGITVTPDAVVVRVGHGDDMNPDTPPSQTLLVGTPR